MTLDELNDAWNEMYAGAQGRGVKPIVPQSLANEVASARDKWRKYFKTKVAAADVTGGTAWRWVEVHRALAARVRAAGGTAPTLSPTPAEVITDIATTSWSTAKWVAAGLVTAAVVTVTAVAFVRK